MLNNKSIPKKRFKEFENDEAWEQRELSNICSMHARIGWQNLRTSEFLDTGDYYLVTGTDFDDGRINFNTCHYVEKKRYDQDPKIQIDNGSILITKDGTLGKVAFVEGLDKPATLNAGVFNVTIKSENINGKYLYQYLKAPYLMDYVNKHATGGTIKHLNQNILVDFPVLLPKAEEQKRIGEMFTYLDNLITLHQRKLKKLKELKLAYLLEMFPEEGEKYPKRRFAGFTDPWEQSKLGELMSISSVKRIHQSDWTDSGIRFLRARDIVSASKNEEPSEYLYISKEKYNEYSAISGKVNPGDLLVTGVGTIGVPMLILDDKPVYFKDGNIIWFKNENRINGKFFYYSFIGKQIQDFINESAGTGTVGTYTIESGKKTLISLPTSAEQEKIGIFFNSLDNLITLHQRKLEKLENIKKAFLNEMFV
nr:restriction endonuclease subunit S [Sedimentibacter sp.]